MHSPVRLSATPAGGVVEPAREGRSHQRYADGGIRLVAGCVPFHCDASTGEVKVMLISNRKRTQWIIPKGGWESDESEAEAASRESYEEAGVRGRVGDRLAIYTHTGKLGERQRHAYFALQVDEVLSEWPDSAKRRRVWVPLAAASALCTREGMAEAIASLQRIHGVQPAPPSLPDDMAFLPDANGAHDANGGGAGGAVLWDLDMEDADSGTDGDGATTDDDRHSAPTGAL